MVRGPSKVARRRPPAQTWNSCLYAAARNSISNWWSRIITSIIVWAQTVAATRTCGRWWWKRPPATTRTTTTKFNRSHRRRRDATSSCCLTVAVITSSTFIGLLDFRLEQRRRKLSVVCRRRMSEWVSIEFNAPPATQFTSFRRRSW